jgi:hypothetical protein
MEERLFLERGFEEGSFLEKQIDERCLSRMVEGRPFLVRGFEEGSSLERRIGERCSQRAMKERPFQELYGVGGSVRVELKAHRRRFQPWS